MLRKCTRCIFLFLLVILVIPCSIFLASSKESEDIVSSLEATKLLTATNPNVDYNAMETTDPIGFYIKNYSIDVDVAENNILHITEVIDCYFYQAKHGIYRDIPIINSVEREDGTSNNNIADINNIKVNNEYKTKKSSDMLTIQIGSEYRKVEGDVSYTISYDYNLGKDRTKKYDELYFNLIGLEWETYIEKVNFTIKMPKDFDANLLGFSSGYKSSTVNNVEYTINDKTIDGHTISRLNKNQALTIRLQLPENYFVGEWNKADIYMIISYVVPASMLLLAIILFYVAKNKNKSVQTVEFYPPDGLNSLDVALIYKGKVNNKDVVSLIVHLANKGYITIKESSEFNKLSKNKLGKSGNVAIEKIKDYDGEDPNESDFMDTLFSHNKTKVYLNSLKNSYSFPREISEIKNNVNLKTNRSLYFEKKLLYIGLLFNLFAIISMVFSGIIGGGGNILLAFVISIFPLAGVFVAKAQIKSYGIRNSIILIAFMLIWSGVPIGVFINMVSAYGYMFLIANIIGIIFSIIILIIGDRTYFRTKEGGELYAKIMGFRLFVKTAEKSRLEQLCLEEPSYFYNILSYAYVLGVSKIWIKKFENIAIENPCWCDSTFGCIYATNMCNRVVSGMSNAACPAPQSSGSGGGSGGSGGGSSGGGSGGGGGGSW